ncbi:MAG: hypothetical protein JSS81_06010 [Acidobacteria bacterium]|nr:hypothetical protein [Acidobacteriota bacterium]
MITGQRIDLKIIVHCEMCPSTIVHGEGGDINLYTSLDLLDICETADRGFEQRG